MRVLIVGAGIVGNTLADQLSKENHDIYLIEQNHELITQLNEHLDIFAVAGSSLSQDVLESIGIQDMDLMIAVTSSDETNILSCLMGSQYGVKKIVARVKDPQFVAENAILNKENTGIDLFINPVTIVVDMLERLIEIPGCTDVAYIGYGDIQIRGFLITDECSLLEQSIRELHIKLASDAFSILAITRGGKTFIPADEDELLVDDRILVLLASSSLTMFLPLLMPRLKETKKIVLFGSSNTSLHLARRLEKKYERVILLEQDEDKCREISKTLRQTVVIHGSALEKGTLEEIVVETVDVFACLSEKDEDNFMAAMMAKQYGAKRTIVLTEKPAYLEILNRKDIDIVINPRLITVGKILQFLRRGRVLSAAKLMEGESEALEYFVEDNSPIVGKSIKKLKDKNLLSKDARIAAIRDGDLIVVPDLDTVIKSGQSIVIFALPEALEKVQNLLSGKKWRLF